MLATLMAALDAGPLAGDAGQPRLVAGTLARLGQDGSAELLVNGKPLALQIRPEAMAHAEAALGQKVTLQLQAGEDGAVTARFLALSGNNATATHAGGDGAAASVRAAATSGEPAGMAAPEASGQTIEAKPRRPHGSRFLR